MLKIFNRLNKIFKKKQKTYDSDTITSKNKLFYSNRKLTQMILLPIDMTMNPVIKGSSLS